jgi:hypothetical protein
MLRAIVFSLVLTLAVLAATAGALAQNAISDSPSAKRAASVPQGTESVQGEQGDGAGLESQIGGLPFTGIDLIVLGGTALVLTGTGFGLHRLSAPRV